MAPSSIPREVLVKEAIRSLRFGECDKIIEAAKLYGLSPSLLRNESILNGFTFKEDKRDDENPKKKPSGQRFSKEQEKETVQEVLKEGFDATNSGILELANSKLGEEEQVTKSWVRGFLNRNPEAYEAIKKRKNRSQPQPVPNAGPKTNRPNAPNRKFTVEQEEELACRILDSNCTCYDDMQVLAEELLEELGKHYETISTHWMYGFAKRYPECKSVIKERSGGSYIVTMNASAHTFTKNIFTYSDHPHMGRYEEAKEIRRDVEEGKLSSNQSNDSGQYSPSLAEIYVEIGRRVLDKVYEEDVIAGFLPPREVEHENRTYIPVMPSDPNAMFKLIYTVSNELKERRQEESRTKDPKQTEATKQAIKAARAAKPLSTQSMSRAKSPLKASDPNERLEPAKRKGAKKRTHQADNENEIPMATNGKEAQDAPDVEAEKEVKPQEATQASKRRKQAKETDALSPERIAPRRSARATKGLRGD